MSHVSALKISSGAFFVQNESGMIYLFNISVIQMNNWELKIKGLVEMSSLYGWSHAKVK